MILRIFLAYSNELNPSTQNAETEGLHVLS